VALEAIKLKDIAERLNSFSWDIMTLLVQNEQLTYTQIKKAMGGKQEKTNKELARLEGALLIESKKDGGDERRKIFYLSQNGMEIMKYKKEGEKR